MKAPRLNIIFGEPMHGWLPVVFTAGDFKLDMDASDVPVDPLAQLVDALMKAIKGLKSEVLWHLEPNGFYFTFEPQKDEYLVRIEYS